jgi:hypothetical protein
LTSIGENIDMEHNITNIKYIIFILSNFSSFLHIKVSVNKVTQINKRTIDKYRAIIPKENKKNNRT